ncbi:MAG: permease prefix domain 1-containing protein [Verrucomicrobiota bacterium]
MEDRPAFNLSRQLERWREALRNCPAITHQDVEELEGHLRDTTAALARTGLSEEEAFVVASHRIGQPSALDLEYACARPATAWKERALWMILGVVAFWVVSQLAQVGSLLVLFFGGGFVRQGLGLGWLGLGVQLLIFGPMGWLALRRLSLITGPQVSPSHPMRVGMLPLIAGLTLLAVALRALCTLMTSLAIKRYDPSLIGGYFLVSQFGFGTQLLVVVTGVWLAQSSHRRLAVQLAAVVLIAGLSAAGCKPGGSSTAGERNLATTAQLSSAAGAGAATEFESCLKEVGAAPNAAVDAFLKLDLGAAKLFSPGSPLSYSEPQFMKLPPAAMDKVGQQVMADLAQIKQLIRTAKARGKVAAAAGNPALAAQCDAQILKLAERLEGPDNLKIAQLVGKAARKLAAE